jgi:PPOX class probable F420-dependent enzyme
MLSPGDTMAAPRSAPEASETDGRAVIPWSHVDLADCPPIAALTTVLPNGYPQTSVVWCDFDGEFIRISTMRGFAKERNMRRDPWVSLLCFDPQQPERHLEVQGQVVEMTEDGAQQHLDELSSKYVGRAVHYFGDIVPRGFAEAEIPVLCRIRPMAAVTGGGRGRVKESA